MSLRRAGPLPIDLAAVAALSCLVPGGGLAGIERGPLGLVWHGAVTGTFRRLEPQGAWVSGTLSKRRVACAQADDVELLAGEQGLEAVRWYWEGLPARVLDERVDHVVARLGGARQGEGRSWTTPGLVWSLSQGSAATWLQVRPSEPRP